MWCVRVWCVCVCSYIVRVNMGKLTMAFNGTMITLHCIIFSSNCEMANRFSDRLINRWWINHEQEARGFHLVQMYVHTYIQMHRYICTYIHTDACTRGSYCPVADIKGMYVCTWNTQRKCRTCYLACTIRYPQTWYTLYYVWTYIHTYMYSTKYVHMPVIPAPMPADT